MVGGLEQLHRVNLNALDRFARHLLRRLQQLGYDVTPTRRSPFTALAEGQGSGPSADNTNSTPTAAAPTSTAQTAARPPSNSGHSHSHSHKELILTMVAEERLPKARARRFTTLREVLEREGVILVNESKADSVEGTAVIRKKELANTEDSAEVYELIEERRG